MAVDKEDLKQLYKEKIIPHTKQPFHFAKIPEAMQSVEAYNPLCGDKYTLYLNFNESGQLDGYFYGFGCAISKASTSILLENIQGMNKDQIALFCKEFLANIDSENAESISDETLKVLNDIKYHDGRMDCVKLSWKNLYEALT